ncbi:uroporphyrinogen decarboxylase family protein [Candidatus Latescibacterota bacterium]
MNGKERILTALRMEEPDRVPVFPLGDYYCASVAGLSVREFATDGENMAAGLLAGRERFEWDGIDVGCDVALEGEALGGACEYPEDSVPHIVKHVLTNHEDLKKLKVPNPLKDGRMPVVVRATEIVVKEVGDDVFIESVIMGPLNGASQARGVNDLMMDTLDRPDFVEDLLDFMNKVLFEFGKAQIDAGSPGLILGEAICTPTFCPPNFYREKVLPRQQKLISDLKKYGAQYINLHVCGDTTKILPDMAETGADILDIDWQVDMADAKRLVAGKAAVRGNLNPSALLLQGTPEEVYEEAVRIIKTAGAGGGIILGSGCDVPVPTPYENVDAITQASKDTKTG